MSVAEAHPAGPSRELLSRRSRARAVPSGQPGSISWRELDWSEDDWAWYVAEHHPEGLTLEQLAALVGTSRSLVHQIQQAAAKKLRRGFAKLLPGAQEPEELGAEWLGEVFRRYDRWRHAERERMGAGRNAAPADRVGT